MIIRIYDRVQLSISSIRAHFQKYRVAMKYTWICKKYFERNAIFNAILLHLRYVFKSCCDVQ